VTYKKHKFLANQNQISDQLMTLRLMKPYYSPLLYQLSYPKILWDVTLDEDTQALAS
jgi:hypothetical protein